MRLALAAALAFFATTAARSECGPDAIQKWTGTGMTTTRPIHMDGPWEIQWTFAVKPSLFQIVLYPIGSDFPEMVANQMDDTPSSAYQPAGGDFYLKVNSLEGSWIICIVSVLETSSPSTRKVGVAPDPLAALWAIIATTAWIAGF